MAPDPLPPRKPISNPDRPKLPPTRLPAEVAGIIRSAFARRADLEAAGARERCMQPMWELAAEICSRFPCLAAEPGVVGIRLCELAADTPADQVWARVRTAPRADAWEYARDHHHCVRVGDWSGWAA